MASPRIAIAAVLLSLFTTGLQAQAEEDPFEGSSLRDILGAIRELESENDAKCQATATRLENFMFGTPLTEDARFEKVRLQKELIADLWRRAGVAAARDGRDEIGVADVAPLTRAALPFTESAAGDVEIDVADRGRLLLTATDVRQYSSVAYSLRAVLAVQQDALISGASELPAADQESVDELRRLTDLYTLAALSLADREARERGLRTLSGPDLARSWEALGAARRAAGDAVSKPPAAVTSGMPPPPRGAPVLERIIAEKIAAYDSYNQLDRKSTDRLFLRNIDRFYARFPMPADTDVSVEVQTAFQTTILAEIDRLLSALQDAAGTAGEPLVRGPIVARVAQELYPHEVDDLEDVTFFPRLPRDRRFVLESYDMDSFRDFGLHWRLIKNALNRRETPLELDLDPFAAEQLAEMTAQLGVLIFRIAGEIATDTAASAYLAAEDLHRAGGAIPSLTRLNAAVPPSVRNMSLASSSSPPLSPGSAFMTDQTAEAGIRYHHRTSDWLSRLRRTLAITPPTFSGGGIAAEDIDGDRWIDLLFVGGMGNALYLNDRHGGFTDVTERAGLDYRRSDGYPGEARQPLVADFDNDGRQDILITYVDDPHRLYRNLGDGLLEDVTAAAGLGGKGLVGGPATTFDFDNDGLLDIYIGYFGNYLEGGLPNASSMLAGGDDDDGNYRGDLPTLARDNTNALPNKLFRNLGGLRFAEVEESGTENTGWAQAVAHTDIDLDGLQDLVVANDFGRNAILRNLGGGRFENVSGRLGMTEAYHSMNVGIGDLNLDGYPDLYISNLNTMLKDSKYVLPAEDTVMDSRLETLATMRVQESSVLYASRADGGELGEYEVSEALERSATSVGWAWDADFFDFDNDGDDDLYVLNGANEYKLLQETWRWRDEQGSETQVVRLSHHDQPNIFYVNTDGRLTDGSQGSGADFVGNSRSAAYLDYDGDGDLDVAVNNFQSDAVLLRNEADRWGNAWIKVRLIGDPERGVNRDAIGARLIATTRTGRRIWREVHGGSGYLSMESKLQQFGLGKEESVDLEIVWPNGERQTVSGLLARGSYLIEQGKPPSTGEPVRPAL